MARIAAVLAAFLIATSLVGASAQERSQGISIHMLPKRVAVLGGTPWGLSVDLSPRLKREAARPVFQTAADLLSFVRKQDSGVQSNGVWIVTTHSDAYSEEEKALLEEVKSMCRTENIPLFISRASQLPNGWTRYDR